MVLGWEQESLEQGAAAVYEQYLLTRTKLLLPRVLTLPGDIPELVQNVYDERVILPSEPDGYAQMREEWETRTRDRIHRANAYGIKLPSPSLRADILGLLDFSANESQRAGEATVRDADESIEVLLLTLKQERFYFVSENDTLLSVSHTQVPEAALAQKLAQQTIRLPARLCREWNIRETISQLENMNACLSKWQESPWLAGELFLILDEQGSARLNGHRLRYDSQNGLQCEKEGNGLA
jgi:CRISPR-associated endonuclease/helicase Cas3